MAPKQQLDRRVLVLAASIVVILGGGIAAATYFAVAEKSVYIDKATIEAPVVNLSPTAPGILRAVNVHEGDMIAPNTIVAQVGVELIKSSAGGLVITVNNNIGKQVMPQDTVVAVIDPGALRAVGQIDEDKGLSSIRVGDLARFTVDAFGGKTYQGVVEVVSPTSHNSDIVFNISDKRQTQTFDIKVRYDTALYPELKNGMSAKLWIYKQ